MATKQVIFSGSKSNESVLSPTGGKKLSVTEFNFEGSDTGVTCTISLGGKSYVIEKAFSKGRVKWSAVGAVDEALVMDGGNSGLEIPVEHDPNV